MMDTKDEAIAREITEDIFARTGQKVDVSDPIVAAALFQSKMMLRTAVEIAEILRLDTRLPERADLIVKYTDDLRSATAEMRKQTEVLIQEQTGAAVEKAKVNIEKAAEAAVVKAITTRMNPALAALQQSADTINAACNVTCREIEAVSRAAKSKMNQTWRNIATLVGVAVVAGGAISATLHTAALHIWPASTLNISAPASPASNEDQRMLEQGRRFGTVYPCLHNASRKDIDNLWGQELNAECKVPSAK